MCYYPHTQKLLVMDVVFHEENMYFHQAELQGEHHSEVQAFDFVGGDKNKIIQLEISP